MSPLEQAIEYTKIGCSVLPCKPDKHPYVSWAKYQKERASLDQIESWWRKFKNANCGIVCGEISGVDVLDIDSREAYERITENFLPESLETPTLVTPSGGYQIWFKHKPGLSNRANYMPQVDVRTNGGFAVVPVSNCRYEKQGRLIEGQHKWLDGLNPWRVPAAPWPSMLFDTLMQCSYNNSSSFNNSNNNINIASDVPTKTANDITNVTSITNHNITFNEGGRDDTLFHLIWYLRKGGMSRQEIEIYAKFVASHCSPPFPPEEVDLKIQSAFERKKRSENGLTAAIRDYLSVTKGNFSVTNLNKALQVITSQDQASVRAILHRMAKKGELIERDPKLDGVFRVIDNDCKPLDWINAECEYRDLWLPLGLGHICGVQPGNVLVFAGAKDSGKTAFLMNIAKENRHQYKVHYFNSEMGVKEWKMRVGKFDDITMEQFNVEDAGWEV